MSSAPHYSERVRRMFSAPDHVGSIDGPTADLARGTERVVLTARIEGQRLAQLAFRAFGCPHLIASAESFCDDFEGRPVADLATFAASEMVKKLEIPVEKTGRILLLEDAVRALQASIAAGSA